MKAIILFLTFVIITGFEASGDDATNAPPGGKPQRQTFVFKPITLSAGQRK